MTNLGQRRALALVTGRWLLAPAEQVGQLDKVCAARLQRLATRRESLTEIHSSRDDSRLRQAQKFAWLMPFLIRFQVLALTLCFHLVAGEAMPDETRIEEVLPQAAV